MKKGRPMFVISKPGGEGRGEGGVPAPCPRFSLSFLFCANYRVGPNLNLFRKNESNGIPVANRINRFSQ